jgi:hypothetical protein
MYGVATMCRVLAVSASGYYAWLKRPLSARARPDAGLMSRLTAIHQFSRRNGEDNATKNLQNSRGIWGLRPEYP